MLIAISLLFNFTLKCAHKKSYSTYILSAFHLHDSTEIKVKETELRIASRFLLPFVEFITSISHI